jgi:hypothetical protein
MIIDTIEALNLLKDHEIRVARSKFVDSPEDAIAFAERRTAPDPRFMPIVHRPAGPAPSGHAEPAPKPLRTEEAIRRAYGELTATLEPGKILAQEVVDPGTAISIVGRTDPEKGKTITLYSAAHGVERMLPIDESGAEILASNFQAHQHHGTDERARRMLEHLLLRVASFFEESGVTDLHLAVRLHENSYTVLDAVMHSSKALHVKHRLGAHARDRKGDDYHPAGRE